MGELYEAMKHFFVTDDWPFTEDTDDDMIMTGFSADIGQWSCIAAIREQQRQVMFLSIGPLNAPYHRREATANYINRVNYELVLGNFEMDFDDGQVRMRTSIGLGENDSLSFDMVKEIVYGNVIMMEKYLAGLYAVMFTDLGPEAAFQLAEDPASVAEDVWEMLWQLVRSIFAQQEDETGDIDEDVDTSSISA